MFRFLTLTLFVAAVLPGQLAAADFVEVNSDHTSEAFQAYVERGLHALANSTSPLGRETFESIEHGRVRIDELADLTYNDFRRVLRDYRLAENALPLTSADYEGLTRTNSRAARILSEALEGYQWEDRIYVAAGQSPRKLAATLVHEVNHVLNKSHVHYYDSHGAALLEEYRAFWVEAVFRGSPTADHEFCQRLKARVAHLYSFEDVDLDSIPDHPPGKLIPGARAWQE